MGDEIRQAVSTSADLPERLPEGLRIVEGLMTTLDEQGRVNIAPMGPMVDASFTHFTLRPFTTSTTYQNMKATRQGVFHVTDDALMIARGAIGKLTAGASGTNTDDLKIVSAAESSAVSDAIPTARASVVNGVVLTGACRSFELRVDSIDDAQQRTVIQAHAVHSQDMRAFLGFCRAKHAIIEAAILATRLHLTGKAIVLEEYDRLQVIIHKTGGNAEHQAMAELTAYVHHSQSSS